MNRRNQNRFNDGKVHAIPPTLTPHHSFYFLILKNVYEGGGGEYKSNTEVVRER
jgi:hypothetical protein